MVRIRTALILNWAALTLSRLRAAPRPKGFPDGAEEGCVVKGACTPLSVGQERQLEPRGAQRTWDPSGGQAKYARVLATHPDRMNEVLHSGAP